MANNPPALAFNSGVAYMVDADTNPTPTNFHIVQSASVDLKANVKELFGQNILPVAVGRSSVKVSGKLKFADYQPRFIRDFIGGANNSLMSAGQTLIAVDEAGSVPGSSAYTIQVTNHSTYVLDLGVRYSTTGIPLTRASSASGAGIYSLDASTGTYTFNSADANAAVLINYTYTSSSAGDTVTLANTAAGAATTYEVVLGSSYNGLQTNLLLYAVTPTGLKVYDTKIGDFSMPEFDFSAFCNSAGNLGIISIPVTS